MISLLILIFLITLFYIAISGRLFTSIELIRWQGYLLFGVAILALHEINVINLIVVLSETLIFKSFIVPYYLKKMITQNKIPRNVDPFISGFNSLIVVSLLIILSFILSFSLQGETLGVIYLTAAFSGITTGLFLIVSRKELIQHIVGYVVLENGIVLLSFSLGKEMPLAVNAGILLDILISVMIFGLFINRIGRTNKSMELSELSKLSD